MTTSGTSEFNLDLNNLVEEAFERCGSELRTGYDLRTARRSLNLLTIEWANRAKLMNKSDLIGKMASDAGISKAQATAALNSFLSSATSAMKSGDKVILVGFGTFSVSSREARKGRNPQTGAEINIPAKKVVRFKAGAELNSAL